MGIRENRKFGCTPQKEWGWPSAIEIFCGGAAGGTYILSVLPYLLFTGRVFSAGVCASLVLVLISVFVLVAESNSLWRLPKAFLNIRSPLALGAISLSLMIILSIATVGILRTGVTSMALYAVGWLGVAVSLFTMIYPGVIMSFMKAIPFWSGSGPSFLFLSAGLLSGSAAVTLAGGLGKLNFSLSRITLWLLVIYGFSLLIYIVTGRRSSKTAQISIQRLIRGDLFFIFMMGTIVLGFIVPLALYLIDIISASAPMVYIGSSLILFGGIMMRYGLIAAGVKIPMLSEDSTGAAYWLDH